MKEVYVAAIDLGSYNITGAIAKKSSSGIEVIAVEQEPTEKECIYKGKIVKCDDAVMQINRILKKLCNVSNLKQINLCYITWKEQMADTKMAETLEKKLKNIRVIFPETSPLQLIGRYLIPQEDKERGCIIIDFGDTSTSYLYIEGNNTKIEKVIPAGSRHITTDLMELFQYKFQLAETLKLRLGKAVYTDEKDRFIQLSDKEDDRIRHSELSKHISERIDDIFKYILGPLQKNNWNSNRSRTIYICGGGSNLQQIEKYLNIHSGLTSKVLKAKSSDIKTEENSSCILNSENSGLLALLMHADKPCNEVKEKSGFFSSKHFKSLVKKSKETTISIFDLGEEEEFNK